MIIFDDIFKCIDNLELTDRDKKIEKKLKNKIIKMIIMIIKLLIIMKKKII